MQRRARFRPKLFFVAANTNKYKEEVATKEVGVGPLRGWTCATSDERYLENCTALLSSSVAFCSVECVCHELQPIQEERSRS